MIERPSGRLILLDSQDRIFLFKVHQPSVYDPKNRHQDPMWIMVGGMVDPGEDFAQAAVREAREETGLIVGDVRWTWSRQRIMQWREREVLHIERFFLGRTVSTAIDISGLDEREKSWTLDHRWWSVDEILASQERFEPIDLGVRLRDLLKNGPPAAPIDIGQ
jgi:8-oxo-dGTP pyrophosphatase MutT (NUDIX family)